MESWTLCNVDSIKSEMIEIRQGNIHVWTSQPWKEFLDMLEHPWRVLQFSPYSWCTNLQQDDPWSRISKHGIGKIWRKTSLQSKPSPKMHHFFGGEYFTSTLIYYQFDEAAFGWYRVQGWVPKTRAPKWSETGPLGWNNLSYPVIRPLIMVSSLHV